MPRTKSEKDEVTIYYWESTETDIFHVALETHSGGPEDKGYYISFYPANESCFLFVDTLPLNFDQLILPDPDVYHSCYIHIRNNYSAIYYSDREDRRITKLNISEDKQPFFEDIASSIIADGLEHTPLSDYRLKQINSLTNHLPRREVPRSLIKSKTTRKGIFHDKGKDFKNKGKDTPPTETVRLYTLDVDKINLAYETFSKSGYDWSLLKNKHGEARNCSGLAAFLLQEGGINNLFSLWGKISTGLVFGGIVGGVTGGIAGGLITTVPTFLPVVGWALVAIGSVIFSLPAALVATGITGLIAAGAIAGMITGASFGAISEYIFTVTIGETLVTPDDIFKFVMLAEQAEKSLRKLDFSRQYQILIDRCQHYSSPIQIKREAITELKSLLEQKLKGEISSAKIIEHVSSYLNAPNTPIFESPFFKTSKVKLIFRDCLTLMTSDHPEDTSAHSSECSKSILTALAREDSNATLEMEFTNSVELKKTRQPISIAEAAQQAGLFAVHSNVDHAIITATSENKKSCNILHGLQ